MYSIGSNELRIKVKKDFNTLFKRKNSVYSLFC